MGHHDYPFAMVHKSASMASDIISKVNMTSVKKQSFCRAMKFAYFPLFTVLFDTIQFTFIPAKSLRTTSDLLFFKFLNMDLGVTYEACQFVLAGLMVIFLRVIYAPQQKLLLSIGANTLSFIWFIVVMFQTVLFMPCVKFLLSGFHCTHYAKAVNWEHPDKDVCWTGRHFAMLAAATFSVVGLFAVVVRFAKTMFTPLEFRNRRFSRLSFALKDSSYAVFLAVIKIACAAAQVFVLEVLEKEEQARDIVNASIMVVALGTFLVFLSTSLPYKSENTLCIAKAVMTAAFFSNIVGLLAAILGTNYFNIHALVCSVAVMLAYQEFTKNEFDIAEEKKMVMMNGLFILS